MHFSNTQLLLTDHMTILLLLVLMQCHFLKTLLLYVKVILMRMTDIVGQTYSCFY